MKITETKVITDTKYLQMVETNYLDRKDKPQIWDWVKRKNDQQAVVIVGLVDYGARYRLIVTSEFRVPINDKEWGLSAGLVDEGETIEDAAKREMIEETGLRIKYFFKDPSPPILSSSGMTNERVTIVYAMVEGFLSDKTLQDSEEISAFIMTQQEVKDLLKDTTKHFGAKAWIVLNRFAETGLV